MSFMDHLEALRWHLMRSVIVWLAAAIIIFVFIDWVYDEIILAPASLYCYTEPSSLQLRALDRYRRQALYAPGKDRFPGNGSKWYVYLCHVHRFYRGGYCCISVSFLGILAFYQTSPFSKGKNMQGEVSSGYPLVFLLAQLSGITCWPPLPLTF